MHHHGPSKLFHWPKEEDACWSSEGDIVCVIDVPSIASSRWICCLSKRMMLELEDYGASG